MRTWSIFITQGEMLQSLNKNVPQAKLDSILGSAWAGTEGISRDNSRGRHQDLSTPGNGGSTHCPKQENLLAVKSHKTNSG